MSDGGWRAALEEVIELHWQRGGSELRLPRERKENEFSLQDFMDTVEAVSGVRPSETTARRALDELLESGTHGTREHVKDFDGQYRRMYWEKNGREDTA